MGPPHACRAMNVIIVMYQTSNSKGQELLAQRMVKWFNRLGRRSWLVTSQYHDGHEVVRPSDAYTIYHSDPAVGVPTIRVKSYKAQWPPRRIMFSNFIDVLNDIDREVGIDAVITHSTLWNGPEETSRWVIWKRLLATVEGKDAHDVVYCHMSHYQPPDPQRYGPIERTYRMTWNMSVFPTIFRAADLILAITPIEAEDMISLGAKPDQLYIFPAGIDDDEAVLIDAADPDFIRYRYGMPHDRKLITFLGTIEERKNPLNVVRVAERLRHRSDALFVIAGKPGDQYDEVRELAGKLNNVVMTGELTFEEKASLIRASYINIILSRMEAFGITQTEFMYGGVPIITSATYGQRWVVRDGVDGIHVKGPDDVDGAAKAVEYLLDNPDVRDSMARNARERASEFLFSKVMRELDARLTSIAKSKNIF